MNELFSVKDKVVVLTGATGVLGSCIARYLAAEGALTVLLGRREEIGDELVTRIKEDEGEAIFLKTDVMNEELLQENLQDVLLEYGRVDALVNLAGGNSPGATIQPDASLFDVDAEAFRSVLDLNLTGTFLPTQVFLKPMVRQGRGSIVNFSSMAAFRPMSRVFGYAAAKAGVSNLTAFLANELARKYGEKIRVNAVAPGFFLTEQNRFLLLDEFDKPTSRGQDVIRQTPFGRFGKPEELCGTVQYLLSDASAFVTGTVAVVDGGFNSFVL
jgi:NAD(P)-dependent dehydrogenase (short-subunit alcohol dehydrogenase family)